MKCVKVVWHDIAGVSSSDNSGAWLSKEQALKESEKLFQSEYTTVGEIIGETDNFIVIAATSDNDTLYSDISMIMKNVIIRIENLHEDNSLHA